MTRSEAAATLGRLRAARTSGRYSRREIDLLTDAAIDALIARLNGEPADRVKTLAEILDGTAETF